MCLGNAAATNSGCRCRASTTRCDKLAKIGESTASCSLRLIPGSLRPGRLQTVDPALAVEQATNIGNLLFAQDLRNVQQHDGLLFDKRPRSARRGLYNRRTGQKVKLALSMAERGVPSVIRAPLLLRVLMYSSSNRL